jgi:pimeloyl-ACP methyl ester carboxylesterase
MELYNKIRQFCIGLFIFILFPSSISAQNSYWTSLPNLPVNLANFNLSKIGDILFTVSGSSTYVNDDIFRSNISASGGLLDWVSILPKFPTRIFWYSSVINGNNIYILGGAEYPNSLVISNNKVVRIGLGDINNITFNNLSSLPDSIAQTGAVISKNHIYVLGGGTWSGGFPIVKNLIYSSNISFSGDLDDWQNAGVLPGHILGHQMAEVNGKVYLIGGYYSESNSAENKVYLANIADDGQINSWTDQTSSRIPVKVYDFMLVRDGDYLILAGGRGPRLDDPNTYDQIYFSRIQSDGSLGNWQLSQIKLPTKTCCAGMTTANGYIYLTGGHDGRDYFNTVWSIKADTVVNGLPTPTPGVNLLNPIVLVPGMGASWNYNLIVHGIETPNEDWKIAPYAKETYLGIIQSLESSGYVLNNNLFVYAYDWRKNINSIANDLRDYIGNKVLAASLPGSKAILIGHSMGGLVTRAAVTDISKDKISKVITLGSPHKGAVVSYRIWEGGDLSEFKGWQSVAIQTYMALNAQKYGSIVKLIQNEIPSFQNILPMWNYLKDEKGTLILNSNLKWQNNLINSLDNDLNLVKPIIGTLAGGDQDTEQYLVTKRRNSLDSVFGRWEDGKPISKQMTSGDETIISDSAIIGGSWKNEILPNTDHGGLCTNGTSQKKLLEWINLTGTTFPTYQKPYDRALVVTLASPATFKIITPSNDEILPEDGLVVINDPGVGSYKVEAKSTSSGKATVYFGRLNNGDYAWNEETIEFDQTGQVKSMTFFVDLNKANLGADPFSEILTNFSILQQKFEGTNFHNMGKEIDKLINELKPLPTNKLELYAAKVVKSLEYLNKKISQDDNFNEDDAIIIRKMTGSIDQYVNDRLAED